MPAKDLLSNWKAWGLPAFAGVLAPWHEKLTSVHLLSEYFQPQMNVIASVVGPLACLAAVALLDKKSRRLQSRVGWISGVAFFLLVLLCFLLRQVVEMLVAPEPVVQIVLWGIGAGAFLLVFISFSVAAVACTLALGSRSARSPSKNIDRPAPSGRR